MAVDAHVADLLLVVASGAGGLGLHAVERGASGLSVEPLQVVDPTRKLSRVAFAEVPARRVGEVTGEALDRIWGPDLLRPGPRDDRRARSTSSRPR